MDADPNVSANPLHFLKQPKYTIKAYSTNYAYQILYLYIEECKQIYLLPRKNSNSHRERTQHKSRYPEPDRKESRVQPKYISTGVKCLNKHLQHRH